MSFKGIIRNTKLESQYLHIVAFNIPYPADYGGVIDVYYKVKALSEAGVRILLHCFQYGREPSAELEDLCFKVYYYPRKSGLRYQILSAPYIVSTRQSRTLEERLLGDSFPVLFEGLHTTALLERCVRARKKVMVRAHNIEHRYYRALARSERSPAKKLFLRTEAFKLRRYESLLKQADHILAISKNETEYFEQRYARALFIPAFHRFNELICQEGSGKYILVHGHLGIPENSSAFLSLVRTVLSRVPYQVIVAGKNPSGRFRKKLAAHSNIKLVADPGGQELENLIRNAQINLLVSKQSAGFKLKLIHALYAGRHCLVNPAMVEGSGLSKLCSVADSDQELVKRMNVLMSKPFTRSDIQERKKALKEYSNRTSAEKILRILS